MIACPNCKFRAMNDMVVCPRCGCRLKGDLRLDLKLRARPSWRDRLFGAVGPVGRGWHRVATWLHDEPDRTLPERSPYQALGMSILPGAGQWYNGQPKTGAMHFAIVVLAFWAGIAHITAWWSDVALGGAIAVMLWSMNHAFLGAQEINTRERRMGIHRGVGFFLLLGNFGALLWVAQYIAVLYLLVLALFCVASLTGLVISRRPTGDLVVWRPVASSLAFLVLAVSLFWGPRWLWLSAFRLHRHNQADFAPMIEEGDRLLFEATSIAWRPRRVGDIVLYDPPPYRVEVGKDLFLVNSPLGMERIVGVAGDVVERREGVFYLNGRPAGPLEQPLIAKHLPPDYRFEVPEGNVAIMLSYGGAESPLPIVTIHAPLPGPAKQVELSVVPLEDVFSRALLVYYPRRARRWITDLVPAHATDAASAAP